MDGKPGCTGNGDDRFCALLDFPEVVGAVAAVGDVAAAADAGVASGASNVEVDDAAAAAVGPVAAMAAATADCLDEAEVADRDGFPDAKATAGEDAIGCGLEADVGQAC